jgi:hypothetical protein
MDALLGRKKQADAHFREAIAIFEKSAGPNHPLTGDALRAYAAFLKPTRKKEAASVARRAEAILSLRKP